jgi:c(7)-type cytochrome triheme protein
VPDIQENHRPDRSERRSHARRRSDLQRGELQKSKRAAATSITRLLSRLVLLLGFSGLLFIFASGRLAPSTPAAALPDPATLTPQSGDGSNFSHSIQQHASLACNDCHRRTDNSSRPKLPGHKACIDCHIQEFTTSDSPLCMNCHTNVASNHPPLKAFPGLTGFNMRFDHAQHMQGSARPEQGCASCHLPMRRGVALSIPSGEGAHDNCYRCHTPNAQAPTAGRDIASCSTCHAQGGYARTPTNARAYAVSFSHATHSARQGLRCDECHQVRAGVGQSRQVTAPRPTQHFGSARAQSCMTCHDNRRAFGGEDFADCKRCHKGQTFRF